MERDLIKIDDPTKSTGYADFSPKVNRQIANQASSYFSFQVISHRYISIIPNNVKTSLVTLVYKNEDKCLFSI